MESKKYYFYALYSSINPDEIRYIGVTSTSINKRFRQHKYCATHPEKCGLPVHKWMCSVYRKGGQIYPKQIDIGTVENWEEKEIYLIQHYKDIGHKLLNLDKGGRGVITEEKRSKSSLQRSGDAHKIPVVAFNLDGTLYKEFDSLVNAAKEVGLPNPTSIGNALNGTNKSAGGYLWKYKSDCDGNNISAYNTNYNSTIIYQFDKNKKLIRTFKSKKEVISGYSASYNGLQNAIESRKEYKGFYWNTAPKLTDIQTPFKYKISNAIESKYFKLQKEVEEYLSMPKKYITRTLRNNPNGFYYNNYFIERV